nr:MAG TPA: hypothetical protein [Caudoviricetes sp.]
MHLLLHNSIPHTYRCISRFFGLCFSRTILS